MTTIQTHLWEHSLLIRAHEALQSKLTSTLPKPIVDQRLLDRAYGHCTGITAEYSKSFHLATRLLPADQRRAMRALYAFCRITDNIVDGGDCDSAAALTAWRNRAMAAQPLAGDLVAVAWADARLRYRIPYRYAEQLIDGVSRDLIQRRYATFDELAVYAYGVASTVGLMSMHIVGFSGPEAIPYAIKLGVALQMTNILRDVGEDWRTDRVYLPHAELSTFGLGEADLARGQVTEAWRAFMRFQIDRNRRLYAEAWPGIGLLSREGRLAVAAAAELYRAILDDIEAHDYDVFDRRAHVSAAGKLGRLPGIWWRSR